MSIYRKKVIIITLPCNDIQEAVNEQLSEINNIDVIRITHSSAFDDKERVIKVTAMIIIREVVPDQS